MYILLGILFLILLFNFSKFVSNKFNEKIPKLIITLSVIFGFLMVVSALSIWFFNTNDPMEIQIAANSIVNNEPILNNNYFSTYPNNLLILLINSLIFKITDLFNISIFNSKILVIINCILISIVSLLIPKIVKLLNFPVEYQFFSYLLFVIFIGFSPWNIIFYSDIFGIFLITLIIFLFLKYIGNSKNIYIYILVFLCFPSYNLKPHIILLYIPIIIYSLIFLHNKLKKNLIKIVVLFMLSFSLTKLSINSIPISLDTNNRVPITHFFMMGLNSDSNGVFNFDDLVLSRSVNNLNERIQLNLDVSYERIKNLGAKGLLIHAFKKNLATYNDGLFSWEFDTNVHAEKIGENDNLIEKFFKNIYYTSGSYYFYYYSLIQSIWLAILFFNAVSTISNNKIFKSDYDKLYKYTILVLSILAITLFLTIFECRARYIYQFTPIYILISLYGINSLNIFSKK
ncbi:MAG: hypothetical protein WBH68_01705 [Erysipelotrichaceae bacterium]